ncbi:MAG: hypothetical protein BWY88_00584 [Synergistetes bacterium ADurb.Bin520]|nr:MAG: hypothetical protein BWY88_00584 [Synergistetes bacterium ADurb.Bin520]
MQTCTREAPAAMNFAASSPEAMPPTPMTGLGWAWATRKTKAKARGRMGGPESHPCPQGEPSRGRQLAGSKSRAGPTELMATKASTKGDAARANPSTSPMEGESFIHRGNDTLSRRARATSSRGSRDFPT